MKQTYRYSHERKEWDYIIKDFMGINGLTLVTPPGDPLYPSKEVAESYQNQIAGNKQ